MTGPSIGSYYGLEDYGEELYSWKEGEPWQPTYPPNGGGEEWIPVFPSGAWTPIEIVAFGPWIPIGPDERPNG
jgi:hypothetical protein